MPGRNRRQTGKETLRNIYRMRRPISVHSRRTCCIICPHIMNAESFLRQRLICVAVIDQGGGRRAARRGAARRRIERHGSHLPHRRRGWMPSRASATAFPRIAIGAGTLLSAEQVQAGVGRRRAIRRVARLERSGPGRGGTTTNAVFPRRHDADGSGPRAELGCKHLKFFPAEAAGGVAMLKALAGPFAHTGVKFVPTGGINAATSGGLSRRAAGRGRGRFVDGRTQTRRGKGVGENHRADRRSDESDCARRNFDSRRLPSRLCSHDFESRLRRASRLARTHVLIPHRHLQRLVAAFGKAAHVIFPLDVVGENRRSDPSTRRNNTRTACRLRPGEMASKSRMGG